MDAVYRQLLLFVASITSGALRIENDAVGVLDQRDNNSGFKVSLEGLGVNPIISFRTSYNCRMQCHHHLDVHVTYQCIEFSTGPIAAHSPPQRRIHRRATS